MGKTLIRVDCVDQRLFVTSPQSIASGGRNEDIVEFNFCPLWDGYAKTAVFYRSENDVYHAVLSGNQCIIPHEVLQDDGIMYFGVFGTKGETTRTSEVIRYRVVKGALTTGTKPSDPTPDIYAQIMSQLADLGSFVKPSEPFSITGDLVQIDNYEGMPMDCVTRIEPVQSGSGDPSPDNIRPISGRTGAKLTRTGKNLLNDSLKYLDGNEIYFGGKKGETAVTLPVGTYTFSMVSANGNPSNLYIVNAVTREALLKAYNVHFVTFTLTDTTPLEFHVYRADYTSANDIVSAQVEIGATMTEHEQYQGETFTADFGQTVYGGVIDWGKGLLTIDRYHKAFDGTENISQADYQNTKRFSFNPTPNAYGGNNGICSHFAYRSSPLGNNDQDNAMCGYQGGGIYWRHDACATVDEMKAYFAAQYAAGTPVQVCYKLAAPITIQLTPQQITALQGVNYIWSDAGETTVSGRKDVLWAANYLPTATATTKGGVKIGKGLQMDGDVLGVDEGEYELIDTIITDGTVRTYDRNVDADGTPYRLKAAMVRVTVPATSESSEGYVYFRRADHVDIVGGWVSPMAYTNDKTTNVIGGLIHGRWFAFSLGSANAAGNNSGVSNYPYRNGLYSLADMPYIAEVRVQLKTEFPAGSKIEIWGVRA